MTQPDFLSSSERLELEACLRRQREDHGIARRANAVLFLDDGKICALVAKFLGMDDDTFRGWYMPYRQDGWKGGQSRMTQTQKAVLCAWLEARFCRSTFEIRTHIAAVFDLEYSHSGCIKLLALLSFEYRKPKALPRVASPEAQAGFIALYECLIRKLSVDKAV